MADDQRKLQTLSEEYQKLQDDLQNLISALQTLQAQLAENTAVQKEFSTLDPESNIYKLVGPVLLKQDRSEAVNAVDGRLDFIEKEIKRTERKIKDVQDGSEKKRAEVMQLQQSMQVAQSQAQQAVEGKG